MKKCMCGEKGYDDCYCTPPPKKKVNKKIRYPKKKYYCRSCLNDCVLTLLGKKATYSNSDYEWYCKRCAQIHGAGFYWGFVAGCGYEAEQAIEKLTQVRDDAKLTWEAAEKSIKTLTTPEPSEDLP